MGDSGSKQAFEVFISYYQKSGTDFAQHLKSGLKDCGITAFRDIDDIPKCITQETDEWRTFIDSKLEGSKNFILVMTAGFNTRPQVLRELKMALDMHKRIYFFKHSDLNYADLAVELDGKHLEISNFEIINFENSSDLLRKAWGALFNRINKEAQVYSFQVEKLKKELEQMICPRCNKGHLMRFTRPRFKDEGPYNPRPTEFSYYETYYRCSNWLCGYEMEG